MALMNEKRLKFSVCDFSKKLKSGKRKSCFCAGFTLVEMMVVLSITAILTMVAVVNYRIGQNQNALNQAANQFMADFNRAKTMTMNGVSLPNGEPFNGYGIDTTEGQNSYILYGDQSGNDGYQGTDEKVSDIYLPSNIIILSVSSQGKYFLFQSPAPSFSMKAGTTFPVQITLKHTKTNAITILEVSSAGIIQKQ